MAAAVGRPFTIAVAAPGGRHLRRWRCTEGLSRACGLAAGHARPLTMQFTLEARTVSTSGLWELMTGLRRASPPTAIPPGGAGGRDLEQAR
jgi:hypothetical protein